MDVEKIKELVELMKANDLSELEVVDGQTRIILKRGGEHPQVVSMPAMIPATGAPSTSAPGQGQAESAESATSSYKEVKSPIVGTFYAAPSPNAEVFVKVGDKVTEDTVICIIEAMKVMNEIKSEISGVVRKILVENGTAVEYDQPLFLVEPE